jgi:hypothetical protein
MADKKLNQVSQLTDFDYALVVKGNDVVKVTKQQLATILGELIGINGSWLRYRGHISDIDNANLNGVYTFGAEAQNSPVDGSGKCLTFGNGIDDYGQIVVTWDSRLIYYRGKIGAAWKRIQTE